MKTACFILLLFFSFTFVFAQNEAQSREKNSLRRALENEEPEENITFSGRLIELFPAGDTALVLTFSGGLRHGPVRLFLPGGKPFARFSFLAGWEEGPADFNFRGEKLSGNFRDRYFFGHWALRPADSLIFSDLYFDPQIRSAEKREPAGSFVFENDPPLRQFSRATKTDFFLLENEDEFGRKLFYDSLLRLRMAAHIYEEKAAGPLSFYDTNGRETGEFHFAENRPAGPFKTYSAEGKLLRSGFLRADGSGEISEFDSAGRLRAHYFLAQNQKNGPAIFYDEKGEKTAAGFYEKDRPAGFWEYFYPGQILRAAGRFSEGRFLGKWSFFSETGRLEKEIIYP